MKIHKSIQTKREDGNMVTTAVLLLEKKVHCQYCKNGIESEASLGQNREGYPFNNYHFKCFKKEVDTLVRDDNCAFEGEELEKLFKFIEEVRLFEPFLLEQL